MCRLLEYSLTGNASSIEITFNGILSHLVWDENRELKWCQNILAFKCFIFVWISMSLTKLFFASSFFITLLIRQCIHVSLRFQTSSINYFPLKFWNAHLYSNLETTFLKAYLLYCFNIRLGRKFLPILYENSRQLMTEYICNFFWWLLKFWIFLSKNFWQSSRHVEFWWFKVNKTLFFCWVA